MIDSFTRKRIEKIMDKYIQSKNSRHYKQRAKLKYMIKEDTVTLIEARPVFLYGQWTELGIAQFRINDNRWGIYWSDGKNNWHYVDNIEPDADFEKQLQIVEQDRYGIFGT